jgi:tetratricopeptide (TPR) repeat protein
VLRVALAATLLLILAGLGGCAASSALERDATAQPPRVELTATPFFPQTEHQCGPAALATVLGAAGHPVEPATLVPEVYLPGRDGSLQAELVAAARARHLLVYQTGSELADLTAEVAAGRPVLVLQRQGIGPWPAWHYAVVVGYDTSRQRLLLRSGTRERLEQRAALFEALWARGDRWAIVLLEPGQLPARPDLNRYMQAAADLERQSAPAATAAYRAAAEHWPNAPLPLLGLGNVAAARADWREAERWYRAAMQADASNVAALNNRVEALQRLGCPGAARQVLHDGLPHVAPGDPLRSALDTTARELESAPVGAEAANCSEFTVR